MTAFQPWLISLLDFVLNRRVIYLIVFFSFSFLWVPLFFKTRTTIIIDKIIIYYYLFRLLCSTVAPAGSIRVCVENYFHCEKWDCGVCSARINHKGLSLLLPSNIPKSIQFLSFSSFHSIFYYYFGSIIHEVMTI